MTRPRCLKPEQTYLVTRRCSERRFFLRPDEDVSGILLYCLAYAAKKYGIEVHAFCFLSNHYHLVLTDASEGVTLPKFMAWLNLHSARMINTLRGRRENLWAPGSYNAVLLADEAAVIDKIVYTICNPVAAGLVARPEDWPGLCSLPSKLERGRFEADRPSFFKGQQPERAALKLVRPPCLRGMSRKNYRRLIEREVRRRLKDIHERRCARGQTAVLGRRAILTQDPESRPPEPPKETGFKPCVACKDRAQRKRLTEELGRFQDSYREAFKAWQDGAREVNFPRGTYLMAELHRARRLPFATERALE